MQDRKVKENLREFKVTVCMICHVKLCNICRRLESYVDHKGVGCARYEGAGSNARYEGRLEVMQ